LARPSHFDVMMEKEPYFEKIDLPGGSDEKVGLFLPRPPTPGSAPIHHATIFLVPSSAGGERVQSVLTDLTHSLTEKGLTVFRFLMTGSEGFSLEKVISHYKTCVTHPRVMGSRIAWVGLNEGADLLAKNFYDLYPVRVPTAVALLSSTVQPIFLNNLPVPYLALHGGLDPLFHYLPHQRIEEAVHHHQMRYGDSTTQYLFRGFGKDLSKGDLRYLAPEVKTQLIEWLDHTIFHDGVRPQEPGVASAA